MKAEITFRSGAQVMIDCSEFKTSRNKLTGELVQFDWTTPRQHDRKLHTIELSEIVCIIAVDEAGA